MLFLSRFLCHAFYVMLTLHAIVSGSVVTLLKSRRKLLLGSGQLARLFNCHSQGYLLLLVRSNEFCCLCAYLKKAAFNTDLPTQIQMLRAF